MCVCVCVCLGGGGGQMHTRAQMHACDNEACEHGVLCGLLARRRMQLKRDARKREATCMVFF